MPLLPGSRLGVYEVTAQIGEGGMGQVYRATDTSLKRPVALKVLPDLMAADPDRLARFRREAEVLASLNHPNIAAIHGLEQSGGVTALVMELVEGEDLAQRIARGAMPVDDVLPVARQIAEALEAAHEQGIVHRDLKPANVKVRPDGAVKVLDFGLAKAMDSSAGLKNQERARADSPTITSPAMTQMGMILGTAAYMAPEQARGKVVDRRADIWAFGVLLFEMLTGRRAFEGDDLAVTLAAVMMKEPDWSRLPSATPPGVQRLMRRCLVKDPRQRIRDMGDVRLALEGTFEEESSVAGGAQPLPLPAGATRAATMRRVAAFVAVAIAAAAVAGAGVWIRTRPLPPRVSRTTITGSGPAALALNSALASNGLAITPDGSRVVYVGNNSTQLFVRALDALEPTALVSGGSLAFPFISPDGQWVGFFDNNTGLKKVAISGGPAYAVATVDGGAPQGGTWLSDDTIVVATLTAPLGLQSVPANGGVLTKLTTADTARGEADHVFPAALPGRRAVLFTITSLTGGSGARSIAVYDLDTHTQTILVRGGSHAQFMPGGSSSSMRTGRPGHLVYVEGGTLRAVSFDPVRLAALGESVPMVSRLLTEGGAGAFAVAADGTLVYADRLGAGTAGLDRTVVWVDRTGKEEPVAMPPRPYQQVRVSPDGTRLALVAEGDIWTWDLGRQSMTKLTFDPASDTFPIWTADGRRIVYTSQRAGAFNLWWQAADGGGAAERLTTHDTTQAPNGLARDGTLLFHQLSPTTGRDIMRIALDGTRTTTPVLQTPFDERDAVVSPDGRWLAYGADTSGRLEVYVRPFPDTSAGQWQISTSGGRAPLWSRDGKELYFFAIDGALMAVTTDTARTAWTGGQPVALLEPGFDAGSATNGRAYDLSPDGTRFLMLKPPGGAGVVPNIIVVQHFNEELKRLAPAAGGW